MNIHGQIKSADSGRTDNRTQSVGMQEIDLDQVIEVYHVARPSARRLLECQGRIVIFPVFVVTLDWEINIVT